MRLGVNIDHIATVRQARRGAFPCPVKAALVCEQAGAQSIVAHLREDRRHIQDADIRALRKSIKTDLNLEMSIAQDIVRVALSIKPDQVTLVPERRQELTTEGGLDVVRFERRLGRVVNRFQSRNIPVSLFIDPTVRQIRAAHSLGVEIIEFHTGSYSEARTAHQRKIQLSALRKSTGFARELGLRVAAGHGLDYSNVRSIARIKGIEELNIGFSIISHALFVGLRQAVKQMRQLLH